jgi:hypothetical protein
MTTRTMRRRLHHGDVDGKRNDELFDSSEVDGLSEPLLGNHIDDSSVPVSSHLLFSFLLF